MSAYLEMIKPAEDIKVRSFIDYGHVFVHPHWHKEVEIIYVKKGTVNIGVNDKPITLHEGDIYIINGGDVHYFFASPNSERIILIFDPILFQELAEAKEKSLKSQIAKIYPSSHNWDDELVNKVQKLLYVILTEIDSKQVGYQYAIKARMFELVTLFFREMPLKDSKDLVESKIKYSEQKEILEKLDL
ncbi:MAG TPA: AraC family transcriptional regulator, partial [Firmicutes bacterium]|nr:AraC family transcriptional regulator [Bacillota bacterium]